MLGLLCVVQQRRSLSLINTMMRPLRVTRGSSELALAPLNWNDIAPYQLEMLSWRINTTSAIWPVFSASAIWDLKFLFKVGMMRYSCMTRPMSPSSAAYFKPPTTVDRLSEFSLTTVTYSSYWYSGPGVMACRISWSFRWKSGTALFLTYTLRAPA